MIQIQKIDERAIVPQYAHESDAGMDLYTIEDCALEPKQRTRIRTGIAIAIPHGYVGLIWDKSGRAISSGMTTLAGVIDASYRGEIEVVIFNTSEEKIEITAGEKIAQMLIQPVISATLEVVPDLPPTTRAENGFGSTGIR